MNQDEALQFMIHLLKEKGYNSFSKYGYDLYIPDLISEYAFLVEKLSRSSPVPPNKIEELSPHFYSAAWELCRRGIIRPGVKHYQAYAFGDSDGYSFTPLGITWLSETHDDYVPTDPNMFSQMLEPFRATFGPGFFQRGVEAIRCYNANAYLACTVMCGASTESILLSAAIKIKSEEEILSMYSSAGGRGRVERVVFDKASSYVKRTYPGYTDLIKYWRDESAHGQQSLISNDEAYISISNLLRFSHLMYDNWQELVGEEPSGT